MKKILFLFAIAFTVISCGNKNTESAYIPKDAVGVMYMNLGSLSEKSKDVDFKNLSIVKMMEENAPQDFKKFMDENLTKENLEATFRNDFILGFMKMGNRMSGSGGLIIPIQSAAAFEKMIAPAVEKIPSSDKQENVGKGDAFTVYANKEMAFGYNEQTALVVFSSNGFAGQELIDLTNLEASENITATDYFKGFFDADQDMGMHITSTPVADMASPMVSSMSGLKVDLKNNNFVYHTTFEEDRLYASMKLLLNDDLKSLIGYDSWMATGYDANLLNMMPNNPAVAMKMSMDLPAMYKHVESLQDNKVLPEMIRKQLKMSLETANKQLEGMTGMTVLDIAGIFEGTMMVALTEGKTVKDSIRTYNYDDGPEFKVFEKKMPYMYAAVSIKDMKKFEELVGMAMMMSRPQTKGKNYYQMSDDAFVLLKGNALFITNDESKADEVYNNGKLASNLSGFEHKSKLDNSMYIYSASGATSMFSDMITGMNPYASMYGNDMGVDDTYKMMSEYFGDSHMIMNADGLEAYTYMKGEGNSLENMIAYINAMTEQSMKMMARF
ncbi:hypothetical protein KORDIASMS9_04624 [Kordia sp. SMS9]|uniref:DUF4836 family protein n=1 Tax=Kordia sp. SMS9 TaxID=2282170 RepID=UPI000E0DAB0B|nr:DUF4836 family protein [Kordia sp. SMS9]AXG72353.1 hypothetical protein KORDIASMS9_04624 [Kordia sp. SMS9]